METNPILDLAASTLVHSALKGSIVLLAAFFLSRWIRSPIQRHFAWAFTFLLLLILPLAVLSIPSYQPDLPTVVTRSVSDEPVAPAATALAATSTPASGGSVVLQRPSSGQTANRSLPPRYWLTFFWMLGVCVGAVYYLVQYAHITFLLRRATSVTEESWALDLRQLKEEMHIEQPVRLVCSEEIDLPAVFGFRRPTIILPLDALAWPRHKRHQVLLHELVHVRQRDSLMQMLRQLVSVLYWFNPLVWKAAQRSALAAECACDAQVVSSGVDARAYARFLLTVARDLVQGSHPLKAALGMARSSELKVRIDALLMARRCRPIAARWVAAGVLCGALLVLALAAFNPVAADQREVPFRLYYAGSVDAPLDLLVDGEVRLAAIEGARTRTSVDGNLVDFELPPGKHALAVRYSSESASSNRLLAEESVEVRKDRRYIAFFLGTGENALLRIVEDDLRWPEPGQQKVRVVHGAPLRGKLSVSLRSLDTETRETGAVLYETPEVAFGDITSYAAFDSEPWFHYDILSASYRDAKGHRGNLSVQDRTITTIVIADPDADTGATGFVFWNPDDTLRLEGDPAKLKLLQSPPIFPEIDLVVGMGDDSTPDQLTGQELIAKGLFADTTLVFGDDRVRLTRQQWEVAELTDWSSAHPSVEPTDSTGIVFRFRALVIVESARSAGDDLLVIPYRSGIMTDGGGVSTGPRHLAAPMRSGNGSARLVVEVEDPWMHWGWFKAGNRLSLGVELEEPELFSDAAVTRKLSQREDR